MLCCYCVVTDFFVAEWRKEVDRFKEQLRERDALCDELQRKCDMMSVQLVDRDMIIGDLEEKVAKLRELVGDQESIFFE